jgi:hypothetical protein
MQHLWENPALSLEALKEFAEWEELEAPETYRAALEAITPLLSQQSPLVHLLDLPTIVIPDLHARRQMLVDILAVRLSEGSLAGQQIFELLQAGQINIICVGDLMHSEDRDKWVINLDGEWTPELLEKEMVRSLGAALIVMELKLRFPEHFYSLRGNHDDIKAELSPYSKFVSLKVDEHFESVYVDGKPVKTGPKGESGIVKDWVLEREGWGEEFLDAWMAFERALPLLAQGSYYVVTHTIPSQPIAKADLLDPNRPKQVTMELTWEREVKQEAIEGTLDNLEIREQTQRWLYGHSRVRKAVNGGRFEEALDGLLVRINNPKFPVFAYVAASQDERRFDPDKDVYIKRASDENFTTS